MAHVGLDISPILHSTPILRPNMTGKFHKVRSEERMERPKKEEDLKMYLSLLSKRKTPILGEL